MQSHAPRAYDVSGLRARNVGHGFGVEFGADGPQLEVVHGGWRVGLALRGYGCPGTPGPVAPAVRDAAGNRVEYRRGPALTEWYVNGPAGLEQGFTLAAPPTCTTATGEVVLELDLEGDLTPNLAPDGDEVVLRDATRERVLRYADLYVTDAAGRELPARLAVAGRRVSLRLAAAGAAYPVRVDPFIATQQGKLIANDGTTTDCFGYAASLSADTAVVGAFAKNAYTGTAYVFVRSGTTWSQQAKLLASDGAAGDQFGYSVSISGDTAVVGADWKDSRTGAAYVFVRSGTTWSQQARLLASDSAQYDSFGHAVSIAGDTAVVGAFEKGSQLGAAYVFVRSGTTWSQQAKLLAGDGVAGDDFGKSVSVSGDTAIVGAECKPYSAFPPQCGPGAVYVFVRSGTTWSQQAKLLASDGANGDTFGFSVSGSGDTAVVGSFRQSGSGAAYVFVRSGTTWSQQAMLVASDSAAGDYLGFSVSVAGDIAVVGGPNKSSYTGAAYAFLRSGTTWSQQAKLLPDDSADHDSFGSSVSVATNTAVVGAYSKDSQVGAAYAFLLTKAAGDPCTSAAECHSGFCVDGTCCVDACTASCKSCANASGTCTTNLAFGQTDPNASPACVAPLACDGLGVCKKTNGQGCAVAGECLSALCIDATCCADVCTTQCKSCANAAGTCTSNVAVGVEDLNSTPPCTAGSGCDGSGVCRQANGVGCSTAIQCASGYCVDGRCCADACTTPCKSCANAAGTCTTNLAAGDQDSNSSPTCVAPNACDGAGTCKRVVGQTCASVNECASGFCVDSTCCVDACTTPCKSCANAAGTCTSNVAQGVADPDAFPACASGYVCDGAGSCKKDNGQPCVTGGECASSACTDGVCCNQVCDSPCHYCQLTGHVGVCTPVPDGDDPRHECQASSGGTAVCAGKCVSQQCAYPDVGTSCGRCSACDGTGRCTQTPDDDATCGTIACSGLDTACRAYQDLTTSRCASLGACKTANDPATCTAWTDVPCADGGPAAQDGGTAGADGGGTRGGHGGCGCVVGAGAAPRSGLVSVLVALALAWGRRRRTALRVPPRGGPMTDAPTGS